MKATVFDFIDAPAAVCARRRQRCALYDLDVGIEIPEALYAVAEVLRAAWEGGEDDA